MCICHVSASDTGVQVVTRTLGSYKVGVGGSVHFFVCVCALMNILCLYGIEK